MSRFPKTEVNKIFSIKLPIVRKLINKEKTEKLIKSLKKAKIPFSFEVSVGNIGKHIDFFIIVPSESEKTLKKAIKDVLPEAKVGEVHSSNIFSFQGANESAYFRLMPNAKNHLNKEHFLTILNRLTKVNTIHEGMSFQLICRTGEMEYEMNSNIRLVTSAGTEMRAKELLDSFSKSLKVFKTIKAKNNKFLNQFINHEFDKNQSIKIHESQLTNFFYL